jgi:hypothetical protein
VEFWSVIKYKSKEGCEDEFIEALRDLKNGPNQDKRGFRCIQLGTGEIAEIVNYESLENMMDLQINSLTWLDSVDHLLERYEDDSRTSAFSGNILDL